MKYDDEMKMMLMVVVMVVMVMVMVVVMTMVMTITTVIACLMLCHSARHKKLRHARGSKYILQLKLDPYTLNTPKTYAS